jgi:hypothetical protein
MSPDGVCVSHPAIAAFQDPHQGFDMFGIVNVIIIEICDVLAIRCGDSGVSCGSDSPVQRVFDIRDGSFFVQGIDDSLYIDPRIVYDGNLDVGVGLTENAA